jgi:hypothetical protein
MHGRRNVFTWDHHPAPHHPDPHHPAPHHPDPHHLAVTAVELDACIVKRVEKVVVVVVAKLKHIAARALNAT